MKKKYDSAELSTLISLLTENGEKVKFTVTGNSMYPLLLGGRDEVVIQKKDRYKRGNVVLYLRENNKCILHRIMYVDKKENTYIICGDNEIILEKNVPFGNVIGEAVMFVRKGRKFSKNNIFYRIYVAVWMRGVNNRKFYVDVYKKIYKFFIKKT